MSEENQEANFVRISLQLEPGCTATPDINYISDKGVRDEERLIGIPKRSDKFTNRLKNCRIGRRNFDQIEIETVPSEMAEKDKLDISDEMDSINFYSGNHCVEVTKGILHLFKEDSKTKIDGTNRSEMLCMLAVPAYVPLTDLLRFMKPFSPELEHIRVIRDSKPNVYMVLLKFRSQKPTDEFFGSFNGQPFNSIEGDICHLVYVSKVEVIKGDEERTGDVPLTGHTELPTCPVCLERMDESVEGILTILCNHSFHDMCIAKWDGDYTCPVCRYTQTPQEEPENCCQTCGATQNLWICLVCGHIGCDRYASGHAHTHYTETEHTFAMQVDTNSVWDYAGDNYVHRLVQNKADGKLVKLESRGETLDEKVDSVQLEYTYMLTSQLEKQRTFFEESIAQRAEESHRQINELKEKTRIAVEELKELGQKLTTVTKERDILRKKLDTSTALCVALKKDLQDEKQMSKCLLNDQKDWQTRLNEQTEIKTELERKNQDLEEQLRDIMFTLEAKSMIENQTDELRGEMKDGQLVVSPSTSNANKVRASRKKK